VSDVRLDTHGSPRLVILGGLVLAVACLYWARLVFIPIALALLITFLLSPVVGLVRRTGLGQVPAVIVVVTLTLLLSGGLGWALFSQLTTLADDLPHYRATIARKIADVQRVRKGGAIKKVEDTAKDVMAQIERTTPATQKPLPVVVTGPHPLWQLPRIIEPLGSAVFVFVLLVFMLIQQRELRARIIRLFGHERLAETTRALDEASAKISRYLLTQSGLNASFGVAIMVGLFALEVPFALVWGFFGALLRFIPYVGAWVAALIPIAMSLAVFDGWMKPLLIAALFVVTELITAFVLEPLFYGRSAGVSAIALLIAAAFWAWLWGPIGLALAIPITVCLVVFSRTVKGLEFIEILVSDESGVEPHITYYQRVLAADEQEAAELVRDAAKAESSEAAYDSILVPALARARHDRETGQLTRIEYAHIIESTRQVLERAAQPAPEGTTGTISPGPGTPSVTIAGCPADDEADRIVLEMLARLLEPAGYAVQIPPAGGLVSEMMAAVLASRPSLICLGSLEGGGRARHLVKRLHGACPDTPILVGCWGLRGAAELRTELRAAGADDVVSSLAEARVAALRLTRSSARLSPSATGATPAESTRAGWVDLEPAVKEVP
jgi:predicted PurR-regulated permease PerM